MRTQILALLAALTLVAGNGCIPALPDLDDDDASGDDDTGDDDTGDDDTGDDDTGDDDTGDDDTGDDDTGDDDTGDDDTGDDDTGDDDTTQVDADGDGYTVLDGDCDDGYALAYPGAAEICDGVADNDCDGQTDGNEQDGDGDFWTPCDGDCDDGDPWVNPDAWEECSDNTDNDCDGAEDCDDVLCYQAPECSGGGHHILVVYDYDDTMATLWADFLHTAGHTVDTSSVADLPQVDMWMIDLVVVDNDASSWTVSETQVLLAWGTPILCVGLGLQSLIYSGAELSNGALYPMSDYDGFYAIDTGHDVFTTPTNLGLAVNTPVSVIPYGDSATMLDLTNANQALVEDLAEPVNYPGMTMVAIEMGSYAFWGWAEHEPWTWSWEGQAMLTNLVEYLVP